MEPILKFHVGSTLLHWAASKGYDDLVVDLLVRGLSVSVWGEREREEGVDNAEVLLICH